MEPNSRTESTQAPTPSRNWCLEQLVKGLNDDHLTIPDADLRGKWVVVTNVADPVAKEAAIQFASWGANVVLTGNTLCDENDIIQQAIITDCKTAALDAGHLDPVIEWMWCSGYLPSIELFAASWELKERPMDILVGNFWDYESANQPMFRKEATELFTTNVLANAYLAFVCRKFLALAKDPRIIYTTSCMQFLGHIKLSSVQDFGNYCNHTLYLQTWLTEMRYRIGKGIAVVGVNTGYIPPVIWNRVVGTKVSFLGKVRNRIFDLEDLNEILSRPEINAQQASLAITNAATTNVRIRQAESGSMCYFNRIWPAEPMPQARNDDCRRMVWDFVEKELYKAVPPLVWRLC